MIVVKEASEALACGLVCFNLLGVSTINAKLLEVTRSYSKLLSCNSPSPGLGLALALGSLRLSDNNVTFG